MKIPFGDLRVIVNNALAFASVDDTLPVLAAVQFTAADGNLVARATDRYKMLRQTYRAPDERVGVDDKGAPVMKAQPVESWVAVVDRNVLKQALAILKMTHGNYVNAPIEIIAADGKLEVDGNALLTLTNQFPEVDRLVEGLPTTVDEGFDGRIGFSPRHLAALDKLRLRNAERQPPAVAFRIVAGGRNAKPVYFAPVAQRDGLTVDGLLMPYKLDDAASGA